MHSKVKSLGNTVVNCFGSGDDQVVRLDSRNMPGAERRQVESDESDEELGTQAQKADVSVTTASNTGCLQSACDKLTSAAAYLKALRPEQRAVVGSLVGGGFVATVTGVSLARSVASGDAGVFAAMSGALGGVLGGVVGYVTGHTGGASAGPAQQG